MLFAVLAQSFAAMIAVVAAYVVAGDRWTLTGVATPISTGRSLVNSTDSFAKLGLRDGFGCFSRIQNC